MDTENLNRLDLNYIVKENKLQYQNCIFRITVKVVKSVGAPDQDV